ncbi:MAG: Na/Pi cotransporter family protein [Opitutales bacterium]|nr:Na/Pi cotransporter family protein [Opitutales bacterium]
MELVLHVIGGLAIFILGMKMMSDGLNTVAGEKMRTILGLFSSNKYVAILTGATVTAVIQSSGATTVMIIGFVNAGLLSLVQAIGIIFGANIGTTITAQLVAFDISWIIMPAITIGLIVSFIPKPAIRNWSETIIGLGFLFFGMQIMADDLKTLSDHPAFMSVFQTFQCMPTESGYIPFFALLGAMGVGLLVTVLMQSSSACSGVIVALGASGLIDIYTATALIFGSNIGSTVTAQLAAIPANRVAKQAAMAHTLFNLLGVLIIVATFYIPISGDPIFFKIVRMSCKAGDIPREIANAHTIFNVCATIILIPFIPLLARICEKIVPVREEKVKYQRLEPHFLNAPSIALAQTAGALRKMLKKSWKMVDCTLKMYNQNDDRNKNMVAQLEERENDVDIRQKDITEYLAKLMQKNLTQNEAEQIPVLLHCTNDAERIGDLTFVIHSVMERMLKNKYSFSPEAENEFNQICKKLNALAEFSISLLEKKTPDAQKISDMFRSDIVDTLSRLETEHMERIKNGKCRPEVGILYLEMLEAMRKISKNLFNIVERASNFYDKIPKVDSAKVKTATKPVA